MKETLYLQPLRPLYSVVSQFLQTIQRRCFRRDACGAAPGPDQRRGGAVGVASRAGFYGYQFSSDLCVLKMATELKINLQKFQQKEEVQCVQFQLSNPLIGWSGSMKNVKCFKHCRAFKVSSIFISLQLLHCFSKICASNFQAGWIYFNSIHR